MSSSSVSHPMLAAHGISGLQMLAQTTLRAPCSTWVWAALTYLCIVTSFAGLRKAPVSKSSINLYTGILCTLMHGSRLYTADARLTSASKGGCTLLPFAFTALAPLPATLALHACMVFTDRVPGTLPVSGP